MTFLPSCENTGVVGGSAAASNALNRSADWPVARSTTTTRTVPDLLRKNTSRVRSGLSDGWSSSEMSLAAAGSPSLAPVVTFRVSRDDPSQDRS